MPHNISEKYNVFSIAEELQCGDIHFKSIPSTQLKAIIAIHSTQRGPALGGCRCVEYDSEADAVLDAVRLAQGMTYKAAIAGINHGGGKSVLIKPKNIVDRVAYFESFGEFVEELGGRYITAVDSGSNVADMDVIARKTSHVVGTSPSNGGRGDPSPYTAQGVLKAMSAALMFRLEKSSFKGIRVAVQGAGNVAYHLCKQLHAEGANIVICDNKPDAADKFRQEFSAQVVDKSAIFDVECEVFSPCARGGVINDETIERIKADIIVGAANNQLSSKEQGQKLSARGTLYVPDFIANAGGLIYVTVPSADQALNKIDQIYQTLLELFQTSVSNNISTNEAAIDMAKRLLHDR